MEENPLHGRFNDMLHSFLLKPEQEPSPSATLRVADLYPNTGELSQVVRDAGLDVVYAHEPDSSGKLNFDRIPDFDFLTVTLPSGAEG